MIKSALGKVMWVGRATVFVVGVAVILAMVVGVASAAFGANGGNFILGSLNNTATAITKLTGTVGGNPALRVSNPATATGSTALDLQVATGKAPMKVNSQTKVTNLNADKLDGKEPGQLPGSLSSTHTISGSPGRNMILDTNSFAFVGPTVSITTSASQRLVGAVQAPLVADPRTLEGVLIDYDLCYQPSGGTTITNFSQSVSKSEVGPTIKVMFPVVASVVPGAGTWNVGFCARSSVRDTTVALANADDSVNGWVQVVNQ